MSLRKILAFSELLALWLALESVAMAGTVTYSYDALGRLISAVNPTVSAALYSYDPAGNITQKQTCGATPILSSGKTLPSANGQYTLNMQSSDGNLVVYGPSGATWASNTGGHPGAYVQLAPNGQLTIYNAPSAGGTVLWVSDNYEGPCATLDMQNDGNLVIYDAGGVARWGSLNASLTTNDRLLSAPPPPAQGSIGQALVPGEQLVSADGRFVLQFQNNGNLVVLFGQTVLWSANLSVNSPSTATMQAGDGNFVVNSASGPVWTSNTGGHPGDYLVMQTDGNLVIYAPQSAGGAALWSTGTGGH